MPQVSFFFLKIALDSKSFCVSMEILLFFWSSSMKNSIGNLINIALNLQIAWVV